MLLDKARGGEHGGKNSWWSERLPPVTHHHGCQATMEAWVSCQCSSAQNDSGWVLECKDVMQLLDKGHGLVNSSLSVVMLSNSDPPCLQGLDLYANKSWLYSCMRPDRSS